MIKLSIFLSLFIFPFFIHAQEVTICFDIKNSGVEELEMMRGDYSSADVLFDKERTIKIPLRNGKAIWKGHYEKPIFITAYYDDTLKDIHTSYLFYVSPGDSLNCSFNAKHPEKSFLISGKGSENNQPAIQSILNSKINLDAYRKDSLPDRVFEAIHKRNSKNQQLLNSYQDKYHPSEEFTTICFLYVQNYTTWTFINFKGGLRFRFSRQVFLRNEEKWQVIEDSLMLTANFTNDTLFVIPDYNYFLSNYLMRVKERIWDHPELLMKYYHTESQEEAVKLNKLDSENKLIEKIINTRFSGQNAEFLYAYLFKYAISDKEDDLPEIFEDFQGKFSSSEYINHLEPYISVMREKEKRTLTEKMILFENPETFKTFGDVLRHFKRQTVLLDMWGTWCAPCRSEIAFNSDSIKNHFKDKEVKFLYIANFDTEKADKWKELIAYYNLTGTHILASTELTKDIMTKVDRSAYPTYVIIKKDGTFELSETRYPMDRNVLIRQIERSLKMNE
jgi:thiol-disulfide isomerase/thioredoxin